MKVSLLCIAFSLLSLCAFAHPPTNIDISTNESTVQIVVAHDVKDTKTHYIKRIELSLNGEKIITQAFATQFDKDIQKAVYFLPALKAGDQITVDADCNIYGDLSKTYTVQ